MLPSPLPYCTTPAQSKAAVAAAGRRPLQRRGSGTKMAQVAPHSLTPCSLPLSPFQAAAAAAGTPAEGLAAFSGGGLGRREREGEGGGGQRPFGRRNAVENAPSAEGLSPAAAAKVESRTNVEERGGYILDARRCR